MTRRATKTVAAWAIVLQSAQRTIPGVKAIERRTFFGREDLTPFSGRHVSLVAKPHLYRTREHAREVRHNLRARFAAAGLTASVVPVEVKFGELSTLASAQIGADNE